MDKLSLTFKDLDQDLYYTVIDPEVKLLFMDPTFRKIYTNAQIPIATLNYKDMALTPQGTDSSWQYKLIDGSWEDVSIETDNMTSDIFPISDTNQLIHVAYDIAPQTTYLTVEKDGLVVYDAEVESNSFMPYLDEGVFRYTLKSTWDHDTYKGSQVLTYDVAVDLPVRFRLSRDTATAGDFITVFADYANEGEDLFINQSLVKWTPTFFDNDGVKMAFIPLNYWAKTGKYTIKLTSSEMKAAEVKEAVFDVRIKAKDFKKQYLYIDETIEKSTRNDDAYAQYAKYFNPSRATITSEKLWDGPFISPVEGRISTEFGEMRYVNDSLTSYRHSGIDFAVPKGTPIKAPNNGHVNLSMFLTLTGNTIVIDHGMGLFSVYFHLDSLNVDEGQRVTKGDIIGTVGTTGFSTGPHLHYTMSIGKVNFDPFLIEGVDPAHP
jgi:murein DD-endopeptidase MepM/ murein hydrolase activator NlpD